MPSVQQRRPRHSLLYGDPTEPKTQVLMAVGTPAVNSWDGFYHGEWSLLNWWLMMTNVNSSFWCLVNWLRMVNDANDGDGLWWCRNSGWWCLMAWWWIDWLVSSKSQRPRDWRFMRPGSRATGFSWWTPRGASFVPQCLASSFCRGMIAWWLRGTVYGHHILIFWDCHSATNGQLTIEVFSFIIWLGIAIGNLYATYRSQTCSRGAISRSLMCWCSS